MNTLSDIRENLIADLLDTPQPSRAVLNKRADAIEALDTAEPVTTYAQSAIAALRRGDLQTGLSMVQAACRA